VNVVKRRLLPLAALLAGVLPVAPSRAESPPSPAEARAAAAAVRLTALSGLSDHGRRYVMKRQRVQLSGSVRAFAEGQVASVEIRRGKRRAAQVRAKLVQAPGGGAFTAHFTARRTGSYTVRATVTDPAGVVLGSSKRIRVRSINPRAGAGAYGAKVRLLQHGLKRLGFATSLGGRYDGGTSRAVLAFRKANHMRRNGFASRAVYSKLFRGRGGFRLRYPKAGKHVEFDWSRQVLVLARRGRAQRIYHASSGKPSTPTVFGSFRVYRRSPGTNSHGMVHSSYFVGGYAIHGYASVPPYPASHGCIRVPIPSALSIYRWIKLGDRVFVYR
jgi:hypothetical protein